MIKILLFTPTFVKFVFINLKSQNFLMFYQSLIVIVGWILPIFISKNNTYDYFISAGIFSNPKGKSLTFIVNLCDLVSDLR